MNSQEQIEFLTRLGFTNNLARIYLALVKSTSCTAYQIAKSANLASEVVYRSMPKLQKMGLVEKIVKTPVEYQAAPIDIAIEYLLEQKDRENADLKNRSVELLASIAAQQKEAPIDDFRIMLIPEQEQYARFTKDKLAAVENSLDVVITGHKFSRWSLLNCTAFKMLISRGVNMRFVVSSVSNEYPSKVVDLPKSPQLKVRFISDEVPACVTIYDDEEVLINTPAKAEFAQSPMYWSNMPCIIGLCKVYFEAYWELNIKQRMARLPLNALVASKNPTMPL